MKFSFKINAHGQPQGRDLRDFVRLAQRAEELGFHGVYCIDHQWLPRERMSGYTTDDLSRPSFPDAYVLLSAIATATSRVKLGPQVTPIGLRHPVDVARWGASLDQLSGGRFVLQAGAGHQRSEYVGFGFEFPPFAERFERMLEGLEVVRRLWTEEGPIDHAGRYYRLEHVEFWPKPLHWPGIWLGGTSDRIRGAVARIGDGWAPAAPQHGALGTTAYQEGIEGIRAQAQELGRTGPIGAGLMIYGAVPGDDRSTRRVAEVLRRREDWAAIPVDQLLREGPVVAGSRDAVCERLEAYRRAGVEELTISFVPIDDIEATFRGLEIYAEAILPRFA